MSHSNYFAIAVLIGLATTFISCSRDEIYSDSEKSKVSLTLHHFGIENAPFTRASEDQAPHRIVFKAFDSSDAVAYETVQTSDQEDFGSLSFELSPGEYTFVAVAHDVALLSTKPDVVNPDPTVAASIASISQATVPEELIQDTFSKTLQVTIEPGKSFSASMSLPRIISSFEIYLNDKVPQGTRMFKIVANTSGSAASGNASFNPSTGLASTDRQYVKEVDISKGIGKPNNHIGLNLFLNSDEEEKIDITATAYNTDGQVIASHTLENVPMKRNCQTVARGNFFTGGFGTLSFLTDWDTGHEVKY